MSQIKVNAVTDGSGGNTATINSMTPTADSLQGFRNRIINGDMRIDQRNAGASITLGATIQYPVDRFPTYKDTSSATVTAQRSTTAPAGFTNSIVVTVSTGATPAASDTNALWQPIEGFNVADLGWGTANAKAVTLSFWVRSSVTGTYSISFYNSASNRFYVATYTVNSANTFEQKTITVAGDTSGTWLTDNGLGVYIVWDLGYGTNFNGTAGSWGSSSIRRTSGSVQLIATTGATFYITGVQLEVGSVATPFERRDYGRELIMCQRYFYKINAIDNYTRYAIGACDQSTSAGGIVSLPVEMRANPTLGTTGTASNYAFYDGSIIACTSIPTINSGGNLYPAINFIHSGSLTTGRAYQLLSNNNTTSYLSFSAEL